MSTIKLPSERHLKYHRRQWQLYLLVGAVMAVGTVVAELLPGENPEVVLGPAAAVFMLMLALYLVVRGRDTSAYKEELTRIMQDEWFASSRNRSRRDALLTVVFAQVPLTFFMAYVPPEPSVVGMGMMTTALGGGVFAASYLFRTRTSADE
jgi:uncharacterized membrane protein YfcA